MSAALERPMTHPRTLLGVARMALAQAAGTHDQRTLRSRWVRHGDLEALFQLGRLATPAAGEPHEGAPARAFTPSARA